MRRIMVVNAGAIASTLGRLSALSLANAGFQVVAVSDIQTKTKKDCVPEIPFIRAYEFEPETSGNTGNQQNMPWFRRQRNGKPSRY